MMAGRNPSSYMLYMLLMIAWLVAADLDVVETEYGSVKGTVDFGMPGAEY